MIYYTISSQLKESDYCQRQVIQTSIKINKLININVKKEVSGKVGN